MRAGLSVLLLAVVASVQSGTVKSEPRSVKKPDNLGLVEILDEKTTESMQDEDKGELTYAVVVEGVKEHVSNTLGAISDIVQAVLFSVFIFFYLLFKIPVCIIFGCASPFVLGLHG